MHSHSWSKMLHQLGHSWSLDHRPSLTWSWRDAAWIETLPRMLAWRNLSLIQRISRTIRYHYIHQLFQLENLPFDPFVGFILTKVRRTGSIKWMHTGTVHDADQESMSLAASVEALSVLNACVEMKKKTSLGMAPPLFSNAMKQNHYNQNLWEHACPKL